MTEVFYLDSEDGLGTADVAKALPKGLQSGAISIGNFDGVHRGHANLLAQVRELADQVSGKAVAVTFDPHPAALLRPENAPAPLTSMATRADRMASLGIDALVVCRTSKELLSLSAAQFFDGLIVKTLAAKALVEGPNFFFGKGRQGNVELLANMASREGIEFRVVEPTQHEGVMISSSLIRQLLATGDVWQANQRCGFRHQIRGIVEHGDARGRTIGFPTANLGENKVVVPGNGVYAGIALIGEQSHPAAIHIGPNPTFDDRSSAKVEVHLLDFDGDLYGQTLTVDFVDRVRDIFRFDSAAALVKQLTSDVQSVRSVLKSDPDPASPPD